MKETWRPIEYDPRYQVSMFGNFRKVVKNGFRELTPYFAHGSGWYIKIRDKEFNCARLVANAFVKKLTKEDRVYHKNKIKKDNFYRNLEVINLKELGKRTGALAKSQAVVEIKKGQVVRWWSSARKAAKDLFMSYQTVNDYCNHKVDKPMYNLMWDKELLRRDIKKFDWEISCKNRRK